MTPVIAPYRKDSDCPDYLRVTCGGWRSVSAISAAASNTLCDLPKSLAKHEKDIVDSFLCGEWKTSIARRYRVSPETIRMFLHERGL